MSHPGTNGVECGFGDLPNGGSATVEVVVLPKVSGTATNRAVGGGALSPEKPNEATIVVKPTAG